MFCLNHRSIKVTLFSEIHIKIISKIILTYHQIAINHLFHYFFNYNSMYNKHSIAKIHPFSTNLTIISHNLFLFSQTSIIHNQLFSNTV